jgi:hypothetical protein
MSPGLDTEESGNHIDPSRLCDGRRVAAVRAVVADVSPHAERLPKCIASPIKLARLAEVRDGRCHLTRPQWSDIPDASILSAKTTSRIW